jgi:hypothetical protein
MQRNLVLITAGIIFCFCTIAQAQDGAPGLSKAEFSGTERLAADCGALLDARTQARLTLQRDRHALETLLEVDPIQPESRKYQPRMDLLQDLQAVDRSELEFEPCRIEKNNSDARADSQECGTEQILNFQMNHVGDPESEIPILRMPGGNAFFFEAGMTIDADGAPNAYHPDNTGLDDLANAGAPGRWEGLAKDEFGEPYVQGPNDPFPGYYVSSTALTDRTKSPNDPARYVDSTRIPFVVMPSRMARGIGMRPGDFAVVFNLRNGQSSYAIFGDVGPSDRIGEGSIALAQNLGIHSDARNGGTRRGIAYLIFPGSGDGWPKTVEQINAQADNLLQAWGGIDLLSACMQPDSTPQMAGVKGAN